MDLVVIARWVGVVLAVDGTVVTAPEGWNLLWRGIADFLRKTRQRVRGKLARWIPWLRRSATVKARTASSTALGASGTITVGTGLRWDPNAPLGDKVALLRQHVDKLQSELSGVRKSVDREPTERQNAIAAVERALRDDLKSVEAALHEHRRRAAEIDARGLPLIGWRILLTGVPEQNLEALPLLWWPVVVIGVALGLGAARRAVVGWRSSRAASAEG